VAASLQAPTLFTIAQDLTKMQVYAKTDESDVGQIRPGQKVIFKVDAFPKDSFDGTVSQVRMNPTTVQNVVTYDTIIDFANPDMKLFPGMTAYVSIPVAAVHNVLKVPNGALRYKPELPPDELAALMSKYGLAGENGRKMSGGMRSHSADAAGERPGGGAGPEREQLQETAIIWKIHPDKSLEPVKIRTGLTDHTVTEIAQVIKGKLNEGDELVIGSASPNSRSTGAPRMGPGMGPRR
jgi:HlyD family secretion protein